MRICKIRFSLFAVLFVLVSTSGEAQTDGANTLRRGVVIENVTCIDDKSQSYALYLPSNYSPDKKWAVLYIFDPFGHGAVPVEIFHEAAEKFGFIVIGSNNSQNNVGGEKLSGIINAFWKDTHARFSIDEKRVYAAGLSGGARAANYFAISCNGCVTGVIASGATFTSKFPINKRLPYSIFGTVGIDDLNFPEMIRTFGLLRKNNSVSHLAVFDGKHQWLTKDLAIEAFEWLNLQAMKSGQISTDKSIIEGLYSQQSDKAKALLERGDILEAARTYESIVADFNEIADIKPAIESLSQIRNQQSYKKAVADEEHLFAEQESTAKRLFAMGADLVDSNSNSEAIQRVSKEIEIWRQKSKLAEDSSERRLARRILGQVIGEAYETALYVNRQEKDYQMMIANLELVRLINPTNSNALMELARALALGNRKKDAIDALEQAIKNGFKDCGQVNGKVEWEPIRGDKRFQKAIEQLNCQGQKS